MKLSAANNGFETNVEVQSTDFGIGDASVVIEILRNRLYAYPIRTLVQEYICNGRDAIRESGKPNRLVIKAPTTFSPTFSVRDYGVGITPQRMNDVFVNYGSSTKRDSNNQTGGFGIGAKSGFSYVDSFAITTYVNGTKRHYIAHVGANSQGRLDLVDESVTDESNGTKIEIAVKPNDLSHFVNAIGRAVMFWKDEEKPELLGMPEFAFNRDACLKISNEIQIHKGLGSLPYSVKKWREITVLIDGICYATDENFSDEMGKFADKFSHEADVVISLPNGLLEVSASREKISDCERNKKVFSAMIPRWNSQIDQASKKAKEAAITLELFIKWHQEYACLFSQTPFENKFNGEITIGYGEQLKHDKFDRIDIYRFNNHSKGDALVKSKDRSIHLKVMKSVFWVDQDESIVIRNKRIRELLSKHRLGIVLLQQSLAPSAYGGKAPLTRQELEALSQELGAKKLSDQALPVVVKQNMPQRAVKTKITKGSVVYHPVTYNGKATEIDLSMNTRKFIYAPLSQNRYDLMALKCFLDNCGAIFCKLSKEAIEQVKNDSNFMPLDKFLKSYVVTKTVMNSRKRNVAKCWRWIEMLQIIEKRLTNVEILEGLKPYNFDDTDLDLPILLKNELDTRKEMIDFIKHDVAFDKLLTDKYFLLQEISVHSNSEKIKRELAFYINAKTGSIVNNI